MRRLTRREALGTAAALGATLGASALFFRQTPPTAAQAPAGPFTLPPLPYPANALEPHIDEQTMRIHHDRHHQAYVTNLNTALQGQDEFAKMPIDQLLQNAAKLPTQVRQAVINNGGGHYNHTMFWEIMGPRAGGQPQGNVAEAINSAFGNFDKFKDAFKDAALKRFGSGWAWLVKKQGKLEIVSTANQDSPIMDGTLPILGIDVWEHAYYLKYQNMRANYIDAWWNVVNWQNVGQRFAKA